GDIVAFRSPPLAAVGDVTFFARVIGLPSETIEGRDRKIYIGGNVFSERYLPSDVYSRDFPPSRIPPDHYWLLGDNRLNARDSTFMGAIDKSLIRARLTRITSPQGRRKPLANT